MINTPALKLKKMPTKSCLTQIHQIDSRKPPCTNTLVRQQSQVLTRLLCKQKKRASFFMVVYNPLTAGIKSTAIEKSAMNHQ